MLKAGSVALLAASGLLASCASVDASQSKPLGTATLQAADGMAKGTATIEADGDGIKLHVTATGLPPGPHGLHLHAVGKCDAPDFTTAGPHLNPHARMHGIENPQGTHLGDLPNLAAGEDGEGALTASLHGSRAELEPLLFDNDGTAIVIHATADDYRTDPSGNSGARIACGVLTRG